MNRYSTFSTRSGSLRVIISLIVFVTAYVLMSRSLNSLNQLKDELPALVDPAESLCLDGLQKLSEGKTDDRLDRYLTGFQVPATEREALRNSFFSPYLIRETSTDFESPSAPIGSEAFRLMCGNIPDLEGFPEKLLSHLASPQTQSSFNPPASSTVVFASITPAFSDILDEAILWYIGGRLLVEQGRGPEAFRVFCGIINLAVALENDRLSHPDKARRMKSCIIREIAAVGLLENSAKLFATKAELVSALAEIARLDKSFVPVAHILAFDKMIPLAFARQIASDVASATALKKYGREVTAVTRAFADQTTLAAELDQIYDPLVIEFAQPYFIAQREYNPWQKRHDSMFSEFSFLFPEKSMRHFILEDYTAILPFYTLIDVKARQLMQGAAAAMAINVYNAENASWPATLPDLEKWLGQPLPKDLIRNNPMLFKPGNPPYLASIGRDGRANTADDLVFMPFGKKAKE